MMWENLEVDPYYTGPWEPLPWYHLARLLAYDVRRRVRHYYEGEWWEIARSRKVAREILEERFGASGPSPWVGPVAPTRHLREF